MRERVPLLVLAGSDRRYGTLPRGADVEPLVGAKALEITIAGRPLIDHAVERLRATGAFEPIFIAGPREKYGERRGDATVIDTDASVGENMRVAIDHVETRFPGSTVGIATCDILPTPADLAEAVEAWRAAGPRPFWFPAVLAPIEPEGLGASSWKPRYRVAPTPGAEPRALLPAHLLFVIPSALRTPLLYTCFQVAYRGRNRSVAYRLAVMVGRVVGGLLWQDLRRLARLQPPDVTVTCLANGIALGRRLAAGTASVPEVERWLSRIFVRRAWHLAHPGVYGKLTLMKGLSLAKDIDTREEAEEIRRQAAEHRA